MASSYDYQRITETLVYSRDHFADLQASLSQSVGEQPPDLANLYQRWQHTVTQGSDLAQWVQQHHRAQSAGVYDSLSELAKYSDIRRPFRLSVIGQKGVGKSALVNALLGASGVQYTPSDVASKALSGTRIRLAARNATQAESVPTWQVVFLTPRRLWEVGSFLLNVARLKVPAAPADLNRRSSVLDTLQEALENATDSATTANQALSTVTNAARKTLGRLLEAYRRADREGLLPDNYILDLDDPNVDGPVSGYIRQEENDLYLIVDYVKRWLPAEQAGMLSGRNIELEDVLGLDDPRDSFFALEAFRESFAVVLVFKCDRPLNSETTAILEKLFSRDEEDLARYGEVADLNKAIIVANRFDEILGGVSPVQTSDPLKAIDGIRHELSRYTRQANELPIYLTSASVATTAQEVIAGQQAQPNADYSHYLEGLSNLLQVVSNRPTPPPDYLDFAQARRAEIEGAATLAPADKAKLILEMSGLPRLIDRVEESLESGSILRGRVANSEYYYSHAVSETALCYARQMQSYRLEFGDFTQPPVSQESRLFARFQRENRARLTELDTVLQQQWFALSQRYIYGAYTPEVTVLRDGFTETIRQVIMNNQDLIRVEPHIATGQFVTDAWRKVFEDINDWLGLECGRQFRGLVGSLITEVDQLSTGLQKDLAELAAGTLDDTFWINYRRCLTTLRDRLQNQAEVLAFGYYIDNRFSIYDEAIARSLHVGDALERREEIIRLLQDRVLKWFNLLWQLLCKLAMTDLSSFSSEVRYYVLGLPARDSLLVGIELNQPGNSTIPPDTSLIAQLDYRYQSDEAFRRQYARREPTPAERLNLEIRDWLGLIRPPLDGLDELAKAVAIVGVSSQREAANSEAASSTESARDSSEPAAASQSQWPEPGAATGAPSEALANFTRLNKPIETTHPYRPMTRQFWGITNPDNKATHTRLHFSRIDLGEAASTNGQPAQLIVEAYGRTHVEVITGEHEDFWSKPFPGRDANVRFFADNAQAGWGFLLDGVQSVSKETRS